ncbi:Uma2 family endonuclease [Hymenobacter sp. BT507]|uniref:Uma2 family endonuclease n=1 Tax=Hymenobacter citatus TaxID=2763506 RepID=A0ABR7MN44_9BACT|nr:Uma2 family endonuclease [Hymenobacter citatus]
MRHGYYRGEVFVMSDTNGTHNIISVTSLQLGLRGRGCRVHDENVRIAIAEGELCTYPDVMVIYRPDDSPDRNMVHQPVI